MNPLEPLSPGKVILLEPGVSLKAIYPSVSERLLSLINAPIPISHASDESMVTFRIQDNWQVVIFYDGGGFDYIDSFISPDGAVVDFWDWPESSDRQRLIDWSPR